MVSEVREDMLLSMGRRFRILPSLIDRAVLPKYKLETGQPSTGLPSARLIESVSVPSSRMKSVRLVQPANAFEPMLVTELGIDSLVRLVQL